MLSHVLTMDMHRYELAKLLRVLKIRGDYSYTLTKSEKKWTVRRKFKCQAQPIALSHTLNEICNVTSALIHVGGHLRGINKMSEYRDQQNLIEFDKITLEKGTTVSHGKNR